MSNNNKSTSGIKRPLVLLGRTMMGLLAVTTGVYASTRDDSLLVVLLALVFCGGIAAFFDLVFSKKAAMNGNAVPFWGGFGAVVCWNPTEGVLFLKNKNIDFVDSNPNDGGGVRFFYPMLGEELMLRVPLEIQTLSFKDSEILTKEYVPLALKGTLYWKVVDLAKFYLLVSKEIHVADDAEKHEVKASATRPKFEVAEYWLRSMAEEKTRSVVSQMGTGLIISDRLSADLPSMFASNADNLFGTSVVETPATPKRSSTESLAQAIRSEYATSVGEYGLEIHRVALQEVKLPPEIYAAAVAACQSAYLPIKAKAEAIAQRLKLQADVDVIGKDAVALREIASNVPALTFQEFLAPVFLDYTKRRGIGQPNQPPALPPS